jgi:hypothetical protein
MGLIETLVWFNLLLSYIKELRDSNESDTAVYALFEMDALITMGTLLSSMYSMFLIHINPKSFI